METVTVTDRIAALRKEIAQKEFELRTLSDEHFSEIVEPHMNEQVGRHFRCYGRGKDMGRPIYIRIVGIRDRMFRGLVFGYDVRGQFSITEETYFADEHGAMNDHYKLIEPEVFKAAVKPMLTMLAKECGVDIPSA